MKKFYLFLSLFFSVVIYSQEEVNILYFQMEPLDDSLFIKIQNEIFIDPPDPKSEIIVDLRDAANQTISVRGTLYPFLSLTPETRARIQTFPFKINLEENITYTSVYTRIYDRIRLNKIISPPSLYQISPTLHFVNPFFQIFGGERFGVSIKDDIGISFGIGTPYSGVMETNMVQAGFHILGFTADIFTYVDALTRMKRYNNHNNLFVMVGFEFSYVIPLGNFFEIGYQSSIGTVPEQLRSQWEFFNEPSRNFRVKIIDNDQYVKWEFRYPFSLFGSTRSRVYLASYFGEMHAGYSGRELSLAGSIFDFRFDFLFKSDVRQSQYVIDILVQQIFDNWGFSSLAIGPSAVLSKTDEGDFGFIAVLLNLRMKVGTSL